MPASCPSAGRREPSASFAPPTLRRDDLDASRRRRARPSSAPRRARRRSRRRSGSPTARPSSVSFILPMSCSAGEGAMSTTGAAGAGGRGSGVERQAVGDAPAEVCVDVEQVADHRLADVRRLDLRQLEHQRRREVRLLGRGLAAEEQPRLAVVVGEGLGADAAALARLARPRRCESRSPASRAPSRRRASSARS